jgi:hypothetical protein
MAQDSIISGLFGLTPEMYQRSRAEEDQKAAMQFARLSPLEQASAGFYSAGMGLGRGIGTLLGAEDPQLRMISNRQNLSTQIDPSNPETYINVSKLAAQSGDPQFAMLLSDAGMRIKQQLASTKKAELSLSQEQDLRSELSKLGQNPTGEQILSVVSRYGSPDKILAILQSSSDRQSRIDSQVQMANDRNNALIEAARERGATAKEIANMQIEGRKQIAGLVASLRQPAPTIANVVDPKDPSRMIVVDARTYNPATGAGVIGVGSKTPEAAKKEADILSGQQAVESELENLLSSYTRLDELKAIPSAGRGVLSNVGSYLGATGIGQVGGRAIGSEAQVERDVISGSRIRLLNAVKSATGMSAQQLNSNVELRTYLDSLSDPTQSIEAVNKNLDNLKKWIKTKQPVKPQQPKEVNWSDMPSKGGR